MSRDINNKYWDEELETLPREELEKRQLADLQEIVKFAYDNAPYYKRSFDEAGVKPEDIKTLKDIQHQNPQGYSEIPLYQQENPARYPGRRFLPRRAGGSARGGRCIYLDLVRFHRRSHHEPVHQEGLR